jgi:ATPase subunit of ABC transporter with duplicated ATPase domains
MLQVNQVYKSYGVQTVLDGVTFSLNPGERVGLVGANGGGKTTLLRIINQEEQADAGTVSLSPADTLGYLPQGVQAPPGLSVEAYVLSGLGGYLEARRGMEQALKALEISPENSDALHIYGELLSRFEALGGYDVEPRAQSILAGLGVGGVDWCGSIDLLSGGELTRLSLARLLLASPSILILDEPTNHLDIQAMEWLEEFLRQYRGAVLVVSHDRVFLDNIVTRILELDDITHQIIAYAGNYSDYAAEKEARFQKLVATWKDQQAEIRRLEEDVQRTKQQAISTERGTNDSSQRRYAKKVARKALSKEKRLQRYLEDEERIEKPTTAAHIRLDFGAPMRSGQLVTELTDAGIRLGGRWLFRHADLSLQYGERVALVGPNGSGKTTLLRLLQGIHTPTEGQVSIGKSVRLGYMPQQQETLPPEASALELVRALAPMSVSEAHHFLHFFLFDADEARRETRLLSYGQRARLLLARLVVSGANCLLLDEPVNHLDIPSRQQFEQALEAFPGTVLVSLHDRAFINNFAEQIWKINGGRIERVYSL